MWTLGRIPKAEINRALRCRYAAASTRAFGAHSVILLCRGPFGLSAGGLFSAAYRFAGVRAANSDPILNPNSPKLAENTVTRDAFVSACHLEKCPICNASPSPNGTGCYLQPRPPKPGVAGSSPATAARLGSVWPACAKAAVTILEKVEQHLRSRLY